MACCPGLVDRVARNTNLMRLLNRCVGFSLALLLFPRFGSVNSISACWQPRQAVWVGFSACDPSQIITETNMSEINFQELADYAKAFSSLTASKEACLIEIGEKIKPRLSEVTEAFYDTLQQIPKTHPLLAGRIDALKKTHRQWLDGLFTGPFDASFAEAMYRVGDVHVKVKLPVEFMAGGMTLINNQLIQLIVELYGDNPEKCREALSSVTAVLGFCLIIMQQSFQASTLVEELDRFMKITGISQKLFNNLAAAYATDPSQKMKLIA
jgi:hypothetical protein